MNANPCPREDDLLDAVGRGFIGDELAAHVNECVACSELHLIAGALLDERSMAVAEAHVPSAGTMLWRMQMRLRKDAQATARRTLLIGQAVTLAIALTVTILLFGSDVALAARQLVATIKVTPLILAVATSILLAPIAGLVAIRQK
jgi:predicted anti-sigma-YlaC factor YlaD